MNIDEYRAYKAQDQNPEEVVDNAQTEQGTTVAPQEVVQETTQEPTAPQEVTTEAETQPVPSEVEAIRAENARLMAEREQTARALQEAEEARLWYSKINEDAEYAKAFAESKGLTYVDPESKAVQELESRYQSLLLERDIQNLSIKYPDFDAKTVVQTALDKGIGNLEDAYILAKATSPQTASQIDMDAIREQIRQEIQSELQSNVSTASIIGSGGGGVQQVQPTEIELTPAELKIATNMGLSPKEYQTWKNRK